MPPELADELRAKLQDLFASGSVEMRDVSGRITPSAPLSWEVRGSDAKPLLHLWTENCNLTRRVVGILSESETRVTLAVERFGRGRPERLELVRAEFQRPARVISREDYCDRLRRILAEQFPDEEVEKISIAADLEHTLSRIYVRGISRKGTSRCAFLAVPEGESPDALDSSLTYALLWLDHARQVAVNRNLSFLRLIVQEGKSASLAYRRGAQSAGQHGVLDLLGITRSKRLAILELKASENPDLPLQAAGYWLRVRRHQAEGHFARCGCFSGLELQTTSPLVYLVGPALRFHPSTDALLRYRTPEMEVIRVGLAESRRRGIRVVMRQ